MVFLIGDQHFPHLRRQFLRTERLLDERRSRGYHVQIHHSILRVGRHVKDLKVGSQGGQTPAQFSPLHPRHDDIGEHQIDGFRVVPHEFDRLRAASRLLYGITLYRQKLARHAADGIVIFDDQDRFLAVGSFGSFFRLFNCLYGFFDARKENLYCRTLAGLARYGDTCLRFG